VQRVYEAVVSTGNISVGRTETAIGMLAEVEIPPCESTDYERKEQDALCSANTSPQPMVA
jgi:hypothetical protein